MHRSRLEAEVEEAARRRTAKLPSYMKPTASSATKARCAADMAFSMTAGGLLGGYWHGWLYQLLQAF